MPKSHKHSPLLCRACGVPVGPDQRRYRVTLVQPGQSLTNGAIKATLCIFCGLQSEQAWAANNKANK